MRFQIQTPAKINFTLLIQKRLPNGYHSLALDFFPVNLFDKITLEETNHHTSITSNIAQISNRDNIIFKAIEALENESQTKINVKVTLEKNIPMGAGLGGGSGNAAGTLVSLNKILNLRLSHSTLGKMALKLGADVAFFLDPKPSLASGIGEKLSPISNAERFYLLLIYPGLHISTKEAYQNCEISKRQSPISGYVLKDLCKHDLTNLNDFWKYLSSHYAEFEQCRSELLKNRALTVGLSGSGSTVFGVFKNKYERDQALPQLKLPQHFGCYPCETLHSHTYLH